MGWCLPVVVKYLNLNIEKEGSRGCVRKQVTSSGRTLYREDTAEGLIIGTFCLPLPLSLESMYVC